MNNNNISKISNQRTMHDKKTRIGITLRVEKVEKHNEKRDALSQDWVEFLERTGVVPVFIPNNLGNIKSFLSQMEIEAVILSGGDNPGDNPERDKTENDILEFCIENQMPILGVCRGMQVINNYFGGSQITSDKLDHIRTQHEIIFLNKIFENKFNSKKINVNSFHHNLIEKNRLGKDLEVFAITSKDSTIEGFYHQKLPIIGVMWHPEREKNFSKELILMEIFYNKNIWKE